MKDNILKFLLKGEASVIAADMKQAVEYARTLHGTSPVASAVLGRTLVAAAIMACNLKSEDNSLTLRLNGGGPAGTVLAVADGRCRVKGYMENPKVDLPIRSDGKLDVSGAVGKNGFLSVVRDLGLKEPYIGRTQLVSGEIAEDVAMYFLKSEQQPSVVYLSVWVDTDGSILQAGGMVVSPLPGASEETLSFVESRVDVIKKFTRMLREMTSAEAAGTIFAGADLKKLAEAAPVYHCDCSRGRFERGIVSLGEKEIGDMIRENGQAEVVCRFCNKKYVFDKACLTGLLRRAK